MYFQLYLALKMLIYFLNLGEGKSAFVLWHFTLFIVAITHVLKNLNVNDDVDAYLPHISCSIYYYTSHHFETNRLSLHFPSEHFPKIFHLVWSFRFGFILQGYIIAYRYVFAYNAIYREKVCYVTKHWPIWSKVVSKKVNFR